MKMTPNPCFLGSGDVAQHHSRLLDAERCCRLVENQHARAEEDGAGDGNTLTLTARETTDRCVDVR